MRLHWPSVWGRARADLGSLVLAGVVVLVVTLLAGAAPPLLGATADDAVRDAVRRAAPNADVLVRARWLPDDAPGGGRARRPQLARDVDEVRRQAEAELPSELRGALRPPTSIVSSPTLRVTDGSALRTFQLTYLADGEGAFSAGRVTWISGGPPQPSVGRELTMPYVAPPWPVQVGLSEADAAALGVGPGDRIPLADEQRQVKDVRVSGIFRPTDDPGWALAPWLTRPVPGIDGLGTTRFGGLLSDDSLPDARLAFEEDQLDRAVRFAPDPGPLTAASGRTIADDLVTLKVKSGSSAVQDASLKWESRLDVVLRAAQARIDVAAAQASVLLIVVLAGAGLVLLLAADVLSRRRAPALTAARQRGAGLADVFAELLVESALATLVFAGVALAVARAVAPGVSWEWALPVALVAALAGPAFGTAAAARATRDRRVPANRSARRFLHRTAELRRAALELAVLVLTALAVVALRQRGILPGEGAGSTGALSGGAGPAGGGALPFGSGLLPAGSPALGVVAGAVVVLRLLPLGLRAGLGWAGRSRRPLALVATARAAATAGRALPVLVTVAAAGLATFALTFQATADRGLADGAWRTVGADARLDTAADTPAADLARDLAGRPGVRQVVAAQITDDARVLTGQTLVTSRLVIVDAAAFQRLLAATPLPDAPELALLTRPGERGEVPALVRSAAPGGLRVGMPLQLPVEGGDPVPIRAVGVAPAVGDVEDVIVIDAGALAAKGVPVTPDTVWVAGPGASPAVADAPGNHVLRTTVLHERRAAPLTAGLLRLALVAAAALLATALLGVALGAAATAPERRQTLSRLRTLGLRRKDLRTVTAGELLPPVLLAALGGPLLGALAAWATLKPLSLRILTGAPDEPPLAVPWWAMAAAAATLLATALAVVLVERHRKGLADVLRAGG